MTKEIEKLIDKYWDEDRHDQIVELIMAVPEPERDIDLLGQLVVAYNNLGRYEDAINLSMELQAESTENISWYYRISYALIHIREYENAADYLDTAMRLVEKQHRNDWIQDLQGLYHQCLPHLSQRKKAEKHKECQEEPLEIVWSKENEKYVAVKGVVRLGYFGEFHTSHMDVGFCEYDFDDSIKEYVQEGMSHDEIAQGLTVYFNQRLENIKSHIVEINQAFLAFVMDDMTGCGYPFWEKCPSYMILERMPSEEVESMERAIYTDEIYDGIVDLIDKYYETAMNGEVDLTTYTEDFLDEMLPMFDYRKMLKDLYAEYLYLGVNGIGVQCSGTGEALNLVCAACVDIQNDNSFSDWHNH